MTNEEAIKIFKGIEMVGGSLPEDGDIVEEALLMAIKALEQQPCEDTISRDAVEKITWEEPSYDDALNVLTEVRDKVRALPSVIPQKPFINKPCVSEGVCREDKIKVLDKIRAEIVELRSRQNVGVLECLDIIDKYKKESGHKKLVEPMQASINSKRKGRWIFHDSSLDGSFYECSCCHVRDDDLPYKGQIFDTHYCNFCPNCGADMRGEKE